MTTEHFIPKHSNSTLTAGSVSWQSPSNIALVKYWGKYGEQLPKNTSISFTLSNCHTKTKLNYTPSNSNTFEFEVYLDGQRAESFEPKILKFFERIEVYMPFLKQFKYKIETTNSFPHSSGIASSASGMSALALCLMNLERLVNSDITDEYFYAKASFLARLGSGSACRSIQGPLVVWGEHSVLPGSSNLVGTTLPFELHSNFKDYCDTILLVDEGEKVVSSTVGHNLMHKHPFAEQRFSQANHNFEKIIEVLKSGDLDSFMEIVESEALSLHAMMMTSHPYFILMKPNTLSIINKIWEFRRQSGSKVCFTLDAGANVHVLYPNAEKEQVRYFITNELASFCENKKYINDQVGNGAFALI
ncbi:diphosphomevalonate decarboxylase [Paucihalobacter ruber]|uniref:Diphosphomevalonate decarboxylase n=1 Tax=Paucihalobacter ruber TaxID=2567861 RepID=A0A506PE89_9FLAO|nr:diphosphomevalonate decarboxylase [Paucihalobacter ruber]TPV31864.1 diphosphomevalonate decarboxylase [Paucihalobacter ruber]